MKRKIQLKYDIYFANKEEYKKSFLEQSRLVLK